MTTTFLSVLSEELTEVRRQLDLVKVQEEAIRAELAERLRGISDERTRLEARARHIQALLALDGRAEGETLPEQDQGGEPSDSWLGISGMSLADAAHRVLLEVGRELHYKDLAAELQLRGVDIRGRDPAINLVAHIHEDPRLIRPKRGVYGLRQWYPKGVKSVGTRKRKAARRAGARRSRVAT